MLAPCSMLFEGRLFILRRPAALAQWPASVKRSDEEGRRRLGGLSSSSANISDFHLDNWHQFAGVLFFGLDRSSIAHGCLKANLYLSVETTKIMSLDEIELEDLCTGRFCEVPKGSDMCMQDVVLGLTLADLQGFTKDEFVSVVRDEHGPWKQCGAWLIAKHENLPYGKTMLEEFLRVSAPVAQATSSWQTAEPDRNRSRRSPSPSRRVPSPVSAEIPGPRKTSPTLSSPRRPSSVAPLEVPVKSSSSPKFSPRRALSPGRGKAATGGNKGTISNLLFKTVVVGGGAGSISISRFQFLCS